MRRALAVLAILSGLAAASLAAALAPHPAPAPVYAVATLRLQLRRDARAWVGRIMRVRGMAEPCPWWGEAARLRHCAGDPLILVPAAADRVAEPVPLRTAAPAELLTVLRRLPLLRALEAPSRAVPLFTPARFRVQVLRLPSRACGGPAPCYEAVLLDVALEKIRVKGWAGCGHGAFL
jgi:hypothetical protein